MAGFNDFVQTELPLRPYLANDVPEESVIIRRGLGPRQLSAITLGEGQVVMKVGEQLQAVNLADVAGGVDGYAHEQLSPQSTWIITHNRDAGNLPIVQVYDLDGKAVVPNETLWISTDEIRIEFSEPFAGRAVMMFF